MYHKLHGIGLSALVSLVEGPRGRKQKEVPSAEQRRQRECELSACEHLHLILRRVSRASPMPLSSIYCAESIITSARLVYAGARKPTGLQDAEAWVEGRTDALVRLRGDTEKGWPLRKQTAVGRYTQVLATRRELRGDFVSLLWGPTLFGTVPPFTGATFASSWNGGMAQKRVGPSETK